MPLSTLETRNKRLIPRWDPLAIGRVPQGPRPPGGGRGDRCAARGFEGTAGAARHDRKIIATRRSTPEGRGSERTCVPPKFPESYDVVGNP